MTTIDDGPPVCHAETATKPARRSSHAAPGERPLNQRVIRLAHRLAEASGRVIQQHFREPIPVQHKLDDSPVTEADIGAEAVMRPLIEAEFPEHGIVGEEFGSVREDAEYVWVIDPIDGTKAFICGRPTFGTLIAVLRRGKPWFGMMNQPITRERWVGGAGYRTTLNGAPVSVRECARLADAQLDSSGLEFFNAEDRRDFNRLFEMVRVPRLGGDCYAYGCMACGFVDLICETSHHLYDFAALVPIVEGAGGIMSDWDGRPLDANSGDRVLAAGDRRVHEAALAVLADRGEWGEAAPHSVGAAPISGTSDSSGGA